MSIEAIQSLETFTEYILIKFKLPAWLHASNPSRSNPNAIQLIESRNFADESTKQLSIGTTI